jgi:hypothetical protein
MRVAFDGPIPFIDDVKNLKKHQDVLKFISLLNTKRFVIALKERIL